MEIEFLEKFYDQLFEVQLCSFPDNDPLFAYSDVFMNVCKRINQVCNNSKTATSTFCTYILNKLIPADLDLTNNPSHSFLRKLKLQENYIKYFTQISIRMFLLSYLCKLGEQNKRNTWKTGLEELIKKTRMEFMFSCHESLATMLVNLINRIEQICNEFTFYEKLMGMFGKYDLDFVAEHIKMKMNMAKESWKQNLIRNRIQVTPSGAKKNSQTSQKVGEKFKNSRKSVRIAPMATKTQPEQILRRRISDFKQEQKKRLSEHIQSGKKRTIFHPRKYIKKVENFQSTQESFFFEEEEQSKLKTEIYYCHQVQIPNKPISQSKNLQYGHQTAASIKKENEGNTQTDVDEFVVPGTPPKTNKSKLSPDNQKH